MATVLADCDMAYKSQVILKLIHNHITDGQQTGAIGNTEAIVEKERLMIYYLARETATGVTDDLSVTIILNPSFSGQEK